MLIQYALMKLLQEEVYADYLKVSYYRRSSRFDI